MYIPTGAITRELYAWWLGLRELFRANDKVDLPCVGMTFSCTDLSSKRIGLSVATRWVHKNFKRVSELRDTFASYGISLQSLCNRYFINEQELKLLANDPTCHDWRPYGQPSGACDSAKRRCVTRIDRQSRLFTGSTGSRNKSFCVSVWERRLLADSAKQGSRAKRVFERQ